MALHARMNFAERATLLGEEALSLEVAAAYLWKER